MARIEHPPDPEAVLKRYYRVHDTWESSGHETRPIWDEKGKHSETIGLNHLLLGNHSEALEWFTKSARWLLKSYQDAPDEDYTYLLDADPIKTLPRLQAAVRLTRVALISDSKTRDRWSHSVATLGASHRLAPYVRTLSYLALENLDLADQQARKFRKEMQGIPREARLHGASPGTIWPGYSVASDEFPLAPGTPQVLMSLVGADRSGFLRGLEKAGKVFLAHGRPYETPVLREGMGWIDTALKRGIIISPKDLPIDLRVLLPWIW